MKKILKYIGIGLSAILMGTFSSCIQEINDDPADLGLGIKVFFPTKVVAGQPMTINGSGFADATEVVFPDGVSVTNFEIVSNDMIRVTAPAGINAEGGKITVRTATESVESRIPLTLGRTEVSGFSKQPGEKLVNGELLTIYGKDLEFVNEIELLDKDANPLILSDAEFYRKGTSTIIIAIPQNIFTGTFAGMMRTFDGREFMMDEFEYELVRKGGHMEVTRETIWMNNSDKGTISWSSDYRFSSANASSGEEIYAIPMDIWERMKTETFYLRFSGAEAQIRVTTGWWSANLCDDIFIGNELITDNGDGSFTLAVTLAGSPIADLVDQQHLLFTGDRYFPIELFFESEKWVEDGGETVITDVVLWENDGSKGEISWSSDYRFSSAEAVTGEEIYAFPMEDWAKIKNGTFYMTFSGANAQIRVTTGWWSTTWTGDDIFVGNERITDNGDGTFTLEINLAGDPILDLIDQQHLLFTGGNYTPLKIFVREETQGGGDATPAKTVFWENDGNAGAISWSSSYRFGLDGKDGAGECIATFSQDIWDVIKTKTFYLVLESTDPQIRVTTGWWSTTWTGDDIFPGNDKLTDNGDGTFTLEINFEGDGIVDLLDDQHLLFTGDRYTPLQLYY